MDVRGAACSGSPVSEHEFLKGWGLEEEKEGADAVEEDTAQWVEDIYMLLFHFKGLSALREDKDNITSGRKLLHSSTSVDCSLCPPERTLYNMGCFWKFSVRLDLLKYRYWVILLI